VIDDPLQNRLMYVSLLKNEVSQSITFWSKEIWELDFTKVIPHTDRWKICFLSRKYNWFLNYFSGIFISRCSFNYHMWYNLVINYISLCNTVPSQYRPSDSMDKISNTEVKCCIHYLCPARILLYIRKSGRS